MLDLFSLIDEVYLLWIVKVQLTNTNQAKSILEKGLYGYFEIIAASICIVVLIA
jgi:hypothetical protein